jgi:hypothetical protein
MAGGRLVLFEERVLVFLFVFSSCFFFCANPGFFSSNAGSNYAITRALAENGSFVINSFVYYTGGVDYAVFDGDYFSDRAPGLGVAAAPFYFLGRFLRPLLPSYYVGYDPGNPAGFFAMMVPVFSGGFGVCLAYLIGRQLGADVYSSIIAALTLGFGSAFGKYAATFFSHAFSAALFLAAVYLSIRLKPGGEGRPYLTLLFFILGYLVLVEYANLILSGLIILYLFLSGRLVLDDFRGVSGVKPVAFLLLPVLLLLAHNAFYFGSPFLTAYRFAPHHPWVHDFSESFSTPVFEGVGELLFSGESVKTGLLPATPAVLLSIWGLFILYRRRRSEALLFSCLFLAHLLFYSKYKTFGGGGTYDIRYLVTVMPLVIIPLGVWLTDYVRPKAGNVRLLWQIVACSLVVMSVFNVLSDLAVFEGHGIREFIFPPHSVLDLKISLTGLMPTVRLLPSYFGILCIPYALLCWGLQRRIGWGGIAVSKDSLILHSGCFLLLGVLLLALSSGPPAPGYDVFGWKVWDEGGWRKITLPFESGQPNALIRAYVYVRSPDTSTEILISARDCISNISVNDVLAAKAVDCAVNSTLVLADEASPHQYLQGLNTIDYHVVSFGEGLRFNAKH